MQGMKTAKGAGSCVYAVRTSTAFLREQCDPFATPADFRRSERMRFQRAEQARFLSAHYSGQNENAIARERCAKSRQHGDEQCGIQIRGNDVEPTANYFR